MGSAWKKKRTADPIPPDVHPFVPHPPGDRSSFGGDGFELLKRTMKLIKIHDYTILYVYVCIYAYLCISIYVYMHIMQRRP